VVSGIAISGLSVIVAVLGWIISKQKQAIDAQKTALEATKSTVDALRTQSDLRIEPLKETINSKDGAIQALEAQLSAAAERKSLAEEKLNAYQESLKTLPDEIRRSIRAEAERESVDTMKLAGNVFFNAGYYFGVANAAANVLQIQSLTFARHRVKGLDTSQSAILVSAEYMKDSVLFLYRERHLALQRSLELITGPPAEIHTEIYKEVEQLAEADKLALESGLSMDPDVEKLSSMKGFPVKIGL
jgi:hypothetical protein